MSKKDLKIKYVIPSMGLTYLLHFSDDSRRELDCNKLIADRPEFKALNKNEVFWYASVDRFQKNIVFTEKLSLSVEDAIKYSRVYDVQKENKKLIKMIYDYGKECRKRQKITQKQMADMIGVPQSSIARLEKGDGDVQLSTILNYLSPLGLTLEVRSKDVPNETTLRAMYEKDSKKSFNSMDELLADLNS